MKIARIETHIVPGGIRNLCIVRIESSDGQVGLGESGLTGRELAVRAAAGARGRHGGSFTNW